MSAFDPNAFDCNAFWTGLVDRCCGTLKKVTVYVFEFCGCSR